MLRKKDEQKKVLKSLAFLFYGNYSTFSNYYQAENRLVVLVDTPVAFFIPISTLKASNRACSQTTIKKPRVRTSIF